MSVKQYDRLHSVSLSFNIKAIFVKLPRYLAWLPVQIRNMVFQSANIHTVKKKPLSGSEFHTTKNRKRHDGSA